MSHAVLSPSGASRWLACTPSARLEQNYPDTSGSAAAEGTLAHSLAELLISYKLKRVTKKLYTIQLKDIVDNELYDNAMFEYCDEFSVFVLEKYAQAQKHTKDALIFLEHPINLSMYVEEGRGTGDVIIIADRVMTNIDLKYGKGVKVSAIENKQEMLYSLGAIDEFEWMYNIEEVVMIIYQPRIDNISCFEISVNKLKKWANSYLIPRAKLAFAGEGEFVPGNHCQFCKARAVCKANADYQLEIAKYEFAESTLLSDEAISDILSKTKMITGWLTAVTDHALNEAIKNGKKWPGYKLVEGRSNRVYTDEKSVAEKLIKNGIKEDTIYTPKKLLGITAMEKEITKPVFTELLSDLVMKPNGKPTLVTLEDKREEIGSTASALKEFE